MMDLRTPWLVAAWPGMGAVARLAADHLAQRLGTTPLAEVPAEDHFHPQGIEVRQGLLRVPRPPRTVLSGFRHPGTGRDLVILTGEQQPAAAAWRYARTAIEVARGLGVERVFTFAAMATPSAPAAGQRVFVAATEPGLLAELRALGTEAVDGGEIGGMNGVFLAAAAERGIPGACLLGEIPFFAAGVPNPSAAARVLTVFGRLLGSELDVKDLAEAGRTVDQQLQAHFEALAQTARAQSAAAAGEEAPEAEPAEAAANLSPRDAARIESLFQAAAKDRQKAFELKAELDRLGVFARYEDRFLDLFRRAE